MSDERDLSNDQRKLEAALAHLKMREPMLDPVAIAYEAGRRSAAWRLTAWRAVAAILLVAITSIALLRPAPRTVEKIVLVTAPATVSAPPLAMTNTAVFTASRSASPSDAPLTYLHLRQKRDPIRRRGSSRISTGWARRTLGHPAGLLAFPIRRQPVKYALACILIALVLAPPAAAQTPPSRHPSHHPSRGQCPLSLAAKKNGPMARASPSIHGRSNPPPHRSPH
jgi:hypothetical protein